MVTRILWRGAKHQVLPSFHKPISCHLFYTHGKGREEKLQDLCSALLLRIHILTPVQMSMSRNAPPWKHWNAVAIATPFPRYRLHWSHQLPLQPALWVLMLHMLSSDAKSKGRRNDSLHPQCLQRKEELLQGPSSRCGKLLLWRLL